MLNFVVCDDNLNLLNRTVNYLDSIFEKNKFDAQVAFKSTNAQETLAYVKANKVNVLILDVQLHSNISGLELAKKVRETDKNCYIIFLSAHLEYVMIAYKYKTFDYIAKPFSQTRLEETLVRLFKDIEETHKRYIKIDNKNTLIDEDEILFVKRDGMKLVYHTLSKNYDTYSSFNKIQNNVPDNFVRCHKSFMVNINKIVNIDPVESSILFSDNSKCEIGPKYKEVVMEVIQNYGITK